MVCQLLSNFVKYVKIQEPRPGEIWKSVWSKLVKIIVCAHVLVFEPSKVVLLNSICYHYAKLVKVCAHVLVFEPSKVVLLNSICYHYVKLVKVCAHVLVFEPSRDMLLNSIVINHYAEQVK